MSHHDPSAIPSVVQVRAGFKMPPANEEEGTSIFMKLFQEAYERENGEQTCTCSRIY